MTDNISNGITIAKKMTFFGIIIFSVILISTIVKYQFISSADYNFNIYANKAVAGKICVLEIGKDLNYISRCTRDIMLGNAYEKNIAKIEKSRANINKNFDKLVKTIKGTPNEAQKLKSLKVSKQSTLAFIDDGYNKMKSLANQQRTPEVLATMYQQYKKDATPLANKSRKAFSKIVKAKNKGLKKRTAMYHKEISNLITFIFIESLIIVLLIIGYLIFLTKNITSSLNQFRNGLISFFDFMNRKNSSIEPIKVTTKDEFLQMANLVNLNIKDIQNGLKEDQKLLDEADLVITRVKNGWYSATIQGSTSNQTIELFKNNVNDMINATKKHFNDINKILEEYANLDYRNSLIIDDIEKGGVFELLVKDINKLKDAITQTLIENKSNGLTLDKSSNILLSNVNTLNTNSNTAAVALEETAGALEEVTNNISNNTKNVIEMAKHGNDVKNSVSKGQDLANQTTSAMDEINTEVTSINEAITVIDQIAFQTNILSLNAAVEAATAGEAGKGFAVVAQEVRNLASRSADAANDIKTLVESATTKANNGKKIADDMINGYTNLNQSISHTLDLISNVEKASREQQSGIVQINDAIASLDKQTQQNANIASETKEVALQTDLLAKKAVSNANEKEFNGKNSVKGENLFSQKSTNETIKKPETIETKNTISKTIVSNTNDDEWASF